MGLAGVWLLAAALAQGGLLGPEVARAFGAVRKGDFGAASRLVRHGSAVIPEVARYTRDRDERVRREAVAVLNAVGGPKVCAPLVEVLADASQDIRDRAALGAYRHCVRTDLARLPRAAALLAGAVHADHGTAAAILLLGYFPGDTARAALGNLDWERRTKLEPYHPVVRQSVPRDAALLLAGDEGARRRLQAALSEPAAAVFLLHASRDIQDRELLASLANLLTDERRSPGVGAEGEPPLRLCDIAVESLAARFELKPSFPLGVRRYDAKERQELGALVSRKLAR